MRHLSSNEACVIAGGLNSFDAMNMVLKSTALGALAGGVTGAAISGPNGILPGIFLGGAFGFVLSTHALEPFIENRYVLYPGYYGAYRSPMYTFRFL